MSSRIPAKKSRDGFLVKLKAARAGKLPWLAKLVSAAGYIDSINLTRKEVAGICGVTVKTVGVWIEKGCPVATTGGRKMSLNEVVRWLVERQQEQAQAKNPGPAMDQEYINLLREAGMEELANDASDPHLHGQGVTSYYQELGRKRAAELGQIKIDIERGRLLPKAELEQQFTEAGAVLRSKLEAIGRKHGVKVGRDIAKAIDEACTQLGIDGNNG